MPTLTQESAPQGPAAEVERSALGCPAPASQHACWGVFGDSVRGASHERTGQPNQDAFLLDLPASRGAPLIVTLSDGHGSTKNFRSEIGAQFAVEACMRVAKELIQANDGTPLFASTKRLFHDDLPRRVVRAWQSMVGEHFALHPLTADELACVPGGTTVLGNEEAAKAIPLVYYGATLLGTVVTDQFAIYFQLGDGEILVVSSEGQTSQPITPDVRLIGNSTTSLCSPDAWADFRVTFCPHGASAPALVLLCTDGYSNSFVTPAEFFKAGSDFCHLIRSAGASTVAAHLRGWLAEASRQGSGDDVTLAIIHREAPSAC